MSLFKKSNRRSKSQRIRVEDSDEEKSVDHLDVTRNTNNNKFETINKLNKNINNFDKEFEDIYENKSKPKTNSKLSFDVEEEECDVFKVKKSSYSRRIAKQLETKKKVKKEIKKEVINENNICVENNDKNKEELNVIWIKSEDIQNPKKEELKILNGDQMDDSEEEDEEEHDSPQEEEQEYNSDAFHRFRGALERGVIPDAKTIYALKKQRQMARVIDDIIPLIGSNDDNSFDENSESRIVREDDNDKSDDEEDSDAQRISFAINRDNIEREKAKKDFLLAQEEDDEQEEESDDSDELDRWEREQIKKGVRMPAIKMITQEQAYSRAISGQFFDNLTVVDMDIDRPSKHKKSNSIPSKISHKSSITVEDIYERIRNKLSIIKESIDSHERQINHLNTELVVMKACRTQTGLTVD